ncbi:MAG TPA: hypothetical protein VFD70_28830 [Anaerolineae bacterium]|nr:hypothetical protein [Anaerolineae bacterium]
MSSPPPNPESKNLTPIITAAIAAIGAIVVAVIGVLPNILPTRAVPTQPAVIVVTATLPPATNTQVALAPATFAPTEISPTLTSQLPTPTQDTRIKFLLVNNFDKNQDFYIDGILATAINSGTYKPLRVTPGTHELKNCLLGSDASVAENCFTQKANVTDNPYLWEIRGDAPRSGDVILLVLNESALDQDIFIDNSMFGTVPAGDYTANRVPAGTHFLQPCGKGQTPASSANACGARQEVNWQRPIESFTILGQ